MLAVLVLSLTIWVVMLSLQVSRTRRAESAYKQAVLTRQVAELAVREYVEGVFKQGKATIEGQIALARSDLERAIDRVEWSDKAKKLGHVSAAQNIVKTPLYTVQDGTKVDSETMKGFRTWRAAACDRCHGANQEGMVGPSLVNSLKTLQGRVHQDGDQRSPRQGHAKLRQQPAGDGEM